jgi:hypothetical protein
MKKDLIQMLEIYKPVSGLDWMNYKLVRKDITFHHIIKRSSGGRRDIDNGALLMGNSAHPYLHIIEYKDIETYNALNKIFKFINQQKHEPTTEQREIIEYLLREFEYKHRWDKSSKGKLLIKQKYLERDFIK